MPARNRTHEARRAARRAARRTTADFRHRIAALTLAEQIDDAYRERADVWCCMDCSPHHPGHVENDTRNEIAAYRAALMKENA